MKASEKIKLRTDFKKAVLDLAEFFCDVVLREETPSQEAVDLSEKTKHIVDSLSSNIEGLKESLAALKLKLDNLENEIP